MKEARKIQGEHRHKSLDLDLDLLEEEEIELLERYYEPLMKFL